MMWPFTKLECEIEQLKERVYSLEKYSTEPKEPKMLADNMPSWIPGDYLRDYSKWEVTHYEVIRRILVHLGLEVIKTDARAPEVKLEKPSPNQLGWFGDYVAKPKRKAK